MRPKWTISPKACGDDVSPGGARRQGARPEPVAFLPRPCLRLSVCVSRYILGQETRSAISPSSRLFAEVYNNNKSKSFFLSFLLKFRNSLISSGPSQWVVDVLFTEKVNKKCVNSIRVNI